MFEFPTCIQTPEAFRQMLKYGTVHTIQCSSQLLTKFNKINVRVLLTADAIFLTVNFSDYSVITANDGKLLALFRACSKTRTVL